MATIFFTNTNQIGDGSLYQTVLEAQEGDVVAPDPTVFGVGERVVIDFADILKIERPITIDAGKTRLILRRTTASAVPKDVLIDCVYSTIVSFNARGIAFNGRVLVGGSSQKHRFDKCIFGRDMDIFHGGIQFIKRMSGKIFLYMCIGDRLVFI